MIAARFLARPNRFIVRARLADGSAVTAHLPDPGRLRELLLPGAPLRLRPAQGKGRRTPFSVVLVRSRVPPRSWVSVDTMQANRLVRPLLESGEAPGVAPGWEVRPEFSVGKSRYDFLLTHPRRRSVIVEVKSVTLVEDGVALFPDAPTARGVRHVEGLTGRVQAGERAEILFVVQRDDAREVRPHAGIDPAFAGAMKRFRSAGGRARAVHFRLLPSGGAEFLGALPVRVPRASI